MIIPNDIENLSIGYESNDDPSFNRRIAQRARRRRENELKDLQSRTRPAVALCTTLIAIAM